MVLFTHHSTIHSNILKNILPLFCIFPNSVIENTRPNLSLNLKFFLARELEISKQNLALPPQKHYKVISPTFKCNLTSAGELDHCLAASQLTPQQDLGQEMNATSNKLQGELALWISCTLRPS